MRKIARTDSNHQQIVNAFRHLGCSVYSTHQVGGGFTDIVVGRGGFNFLVEIKDGEKSPSQRELTKDEEVFHFGWCGRVDIAESVEDVVQLILEWDRLIKGVRGCK